MEKAKAAVSDFMHKAGHHDTTVHEKVAPSVTHETVKPHQHENVTTAVDKEVHQDHYHRTVQPVHDREVLPEQHHTKLGAVQHREFDHRDAEGTNRALAADQGQFRNESITHDKTHSQSAAPTVGGEHVHHHIHETIQPVVEKETVQPHVVHTTVPIHEIHHNAAKHHETSTLPAVSMDEFKGKGGVLGGREERYDGFEGEPRNIGGTLGSMKPHGKHDSHHTSGSVPGHSTHGDHNPLHGTERHGDMHGATGATGTTGTGALAGAERGMEHPRTGAHDASTSDYSRGAGNGPLDSRREGDTTKKPSMMDKLNPMKDSDGDGKKGFMK